MTSAPSERTDEVERRLDLYWIPLGAGTPVVAFSGRVYEAIHGAVRRHPRHDLYHAALVADLDGTSTIIESAPVPDDDGHVARGVVAGGAVGSRLLGRLRVFRYEVRRWPGGTIPDIGYAVASPVRISDDGDAVRAVLDLVASVPAPVWGRDELDAGDMWNSNSVVSWTLTRAGLLAEAGAPPPGGRAPGWDAGVRVAERLGDAPP
jgi:hypothetical protein